MSFNASNVKAAVVKKALSFDGPSDYEQLHERPLIQWCASRREPEEEYQRRISVLSRLDNLVKLWVRSVMVTEFRMAPEAAAREVVPRVYTTGSFRYNVHSSGSDIDAVLIAPYRVTRQHFFTSFVERLKGESAWITSIDLVTDAIVPILALKCDGIDIDLSFGSIKLSKVPEEITDDLLRDLDEQSVRSCNAVRVAQNVIDLVPNAGPFRQALRFVKAWGKARGIYSSKFGYPSGIGWALLVAFISQCYPNQNGSGLVCRFFRVYSKWFRSDVLQTGEPNHAIFLTESLKPATNIGACWPASSKDQQALFPVITPANPYANSCYNVTLTTLRILCSEFARGHEICSKRMPLPVPTAASTSGSSPVVFGFWPDVLEPYPFFSAHKHYLQVQVQAVPAHYQRFVDAVEAKIRFLWAESPSLNRGRALECFASVRVHVYSARFELATEKARRAQKDPAAASAAASGAAPPAAAGPMPTDHVGGPVDEYHTAYFFLGLDIAATPSAGAAATPLAGAKLDLAAVVQAFRSIVADIKEYKPPLTKLPAVAILNPTQIPEWIVAEAGGAPRKRPRDEEELAGNDGSAPPPPPPPSGAPPPTASLHQPAAVPLPIVAGSVVLPGAAAAVPAAVVVTAPVAALPRRQQPAPPAPAQLLDDALGMDF